jgi:endogenous inhibitor of DNA gyrase (YacG/DUF329 family)
MSAAPSGAKPLRCPICGKEATEDYRPFCSKRCADIDLARWFTGGYAIAGRDDDEGDNATPPENGTSSRDEDDEA